MWSQAPTDRQLRYKEKVTELRRKRNSGLNKEQKEKHMVSWGEMNACPSSTSLLCIPPTLDFESVSAFPVRPHRQDHRQSHGASREPLLENITSDYDLELFRKAQARASDDLVREKTHHHLPPLLFPPSLSFLSPPCLRYSSSSLFQSANPPLQPQEESEIFLVVWTITSCYSVFVFPSALLLCDPFR